MKRPRRREATLLAAGIATVAAVASAQPCEPYWSDEFPSGELDAWVWGMTVFDDGSGDGAALYIGGGFTTGGDVTLNGIGRLDGNRWTPLGNGMDGNVWALTGFDDGSGDGPALYAGGGFSTAGGVRVNNIARWDGASWSPLSGGVDGGGALALAVFDDGSGGGPALYIGGGFSTAGGVRVNNIAKWDGKSWSPVGSGMDGPVKALAVFDDGSGGGPALYAGGYFTAADGVKANHIGKWDGTSWSPVGSGMDDTVKALAVFDDGSGSGPALYAAGTFETAGGVTVNRIAKWDGESWSALGEGTDDSVYALAVFDDGSGGGPALYAGGYFTTAGGVTVNRIAKWDGASWSALGVGVDGGSIQALAAFDDGSDDGPALYAGGFFQSAGEADARFFAKWDGSAWAGVGGGVSGGEGIYSLLVFDDDDGGGPALYVGGEFTAAGGIAANCIARFDGQLWSSVGTAMDDQMGSASALAVFDDGSGDALYAGGWFLSIGGTPANSIAKWDGSTWSALASGVSGWVLTMAVFDDGSGSGPALYAGGYFTEAGGVSAENIAKWDGTTWSPLGTGLSGPSPTRVWALAVFDDGSGDGPALYVGGEFTIAGGVAASNIAKWDGITWSPLGSGLNSGVYALTVFDDGASGGPALYAGGYFGQTGDDLTVSHIAKWDGSTWSPLGDGVSGPYVLSLGAFSDGLSRHPTLYAGGYFWEAGGLPANNIAKWDGTAWWPLGEGLEGWLDPHVWDLTVFDDGSGTGPAMFAGGEFTTAGGMSSQGIAEWVGCAGAVIGDLDSDGVVGILDLLILLGSWGPCPDPPDNCPADLDGDGTVGILDLLTLLANWTGG